MSKVIVKNATTGQELLWLSVKIKKSLDEICHTLELEIPLSELRKVRKHHKLEVRCQNELDVSFGGERCVTTVLVDEVTPGADTDKYGITVVGRSPARDIIDSAWTDDFSRSEDFRERTLREVTQAVGDKFGVICDSFPTNRPDPTDTVHEFLITNESPWPKLIDEADNQGFIFTSNEIGNLYLWKAQATLRDEPFHITEGVNVKNIKWKENGSEQFHEYAVIGGYNPDTGENLEVRITDPTCPGNRILIIDTEDPYIDLPKLERRAKTEMLRRREIKTTVTVPGWGLTDEQIRGLGPTIRLEIYWVPNLLIPVSIPSFGLDANLLISEVEYTATADTLSCDITLVNREMYA
jgi:prophage tail gpP-like protein